MKSEFVLALLDAALLNERERVVKVAMQIEASAVETGKSGIADRIRRMLRRQPMTPTPLRDCLGLQAYQPTRELCDLVLAADVAASLAELIEERQHASLLEEHGLPPRHKLLFVGPPGNGKTAAAEAIATALDLPLFVADYANIANSYLGDTEKSVVRVIERASQQPCVLLFDEVDSLLSSRVDCRNSADRSHNSAVNVLLVALDRLPTSVLFIAATNRDGDLDSACRRRFHTTLTFAPPSESQRERYLSTLVGRYPSLASDYAAPAVESFAEIEREAQNEARRRLLASATKLNGHPASWGGGSAAARPVCSSSESRGLGPDGRVELGR